MSAATKSLSVARQQRRASIIESAGTAGIVTRSAMILTSSVNTRDGGHMTGLYENTYQLQPDHAPKGCELQQIVQDVLTEQLRDRTYSSSLGAMTKTLAEEMKQRAKALGLPRYKYVAVVVLGPVQRTSVAMGSRCVWSPAFDTFGEYTFRNESITATGIIYGLYVE